MKKREFLIALYAIICVSVLISASYLLIYDSLDDMFDLHQVVSDKIEEYKYWYDDSDNDVGLHHSLPTLEDYGVDDEENDETHSVVVTENGDIISTSQDKSAEYGVYSTSCLDIDQYLDNNGELPDAWWYDEDFTTYYSQRWAYPMLVDCDYYSNAKLESRSDFSETYRSSNNITGHNVFITIYSGKDMYNIQEYYVLTNEDDGIRRFVTVDSRCGKTGVVVTYEEEHALNGTFYSFSVGNFSVFVHCVGCEPMPDEDISILIDNVMLY